jgi:hypothetical protein
LIRGRERAAGALGLACLAAACAKVAPPPGGPEDREAPSIVADAVQPAPGAAAVAPDSVVTIVFSERTDQRSVMRSLALFPRVDFREASWSDDTLRLRPEPSWPEDRPVMMRIGPGARDRRGNPIGQPYALRFTTRALADTGGISGKLWPGREKNSAARLLAFAYPADTAGTEPWSLADVDASGEFTLEGLDTAAEWRIAGLIDMDGDARPGGASEAWSWAPDVVRFAPETTTVRIADFLVGTLDSLGTIRGDLRADSAASVRAEAIGATGRREVSDPLVGGGAFTLKVPTGQTYRIAAFEDVDADGVADPEERRAVLEEDIRLDLSAERSGITFDLTTPASPGTAPVEEAPLEDDAPKSPPPPGEAEDPR